MSGEAADADIVGKIRGGIITGVSVGYVRHRVEKVDDSNRKRPLHRVVDWEPKELTVCALGADPGAMLLRANVPAAEAALVRMALSARRLRTDVAAVGAGRVQPARAAQARMVLAERRLTA